MVGGYTVNNGGATPLWKALGYKSEQEYINATSGANGSKKAVSPLVGVGNKLPGVPTKIPTNQTTVKMPTLQTAYGGLVGGGKTGGVTNEGVIIGNPNVNNDTFRNPSSMPKLPTTIGGNTVTLPTNGIKLPSGVTPTSPIGSAQNPTQNETTQPTERTDEGSWNGTNSFLEWYKENYGTDFDSSVGFTRREGMNDGIWNVGKNLYDYYLQGLDDEQNRANEEANRNKYYDEQLEAMLGEYASSRDALDKSKRQSQQSASITLDKLKKYLPTQIKSQGLGGLGVSESTMLQAYNNYNNDMGAIESDFQANKTSLDVGENNAKNTLENYRQDALQKIAEKYGAAADARQAEAGSTSKNIFSAYEAQVREQLQQRISDIKSLIGASTSTSAGELLNYVESLRGQIDNNDFSALQEIARYKADENLKAKQEEDRLNAINSIKDGLAKFDTYEDWEGALKYIEQNKSALGDKEYNSLISQYTGWAEKAKTDKAEADKAAQEEKDKRIVTGQEAFEYNGKYYQIGSRLDNNANEIKHNNDFKDQLKALGFDDPFDKNIPNGTTLTVKSDAYGSNEHNWKDWVGGIDITDWRNWVPGYNIYNQINNWANLETRTLTYYNGQWYSSSEVGR